MMLARLVICTRRSFISVEFNTRNPMQLLKTEPSHFIFEIRLNEDLNQQFYYRVAQQSHLTTA